AAALCQLGRSRGSGTDIADIARRGAAKLTGTAVQDLLTLIVMSCVPFQAQSAANMSILASFVTQQQAIGEAPDND
ncbi:MAG TPA: hypothetical protein VF055_05065, partial [Steroidobacteraceae bacterium]